MTVINRAKDALPSTISLGQFAEEMKQLNLTNIPPEQRALMVKEHLSRIMVGTLENRTIAAEIAEAKILRAAIISNLSGYASIALPPAPKAFH